MKTAILFLFLFTLQSSFIFPTDKECLLKEETIDKKPALIIELTNDKRITELTAIFKKNGYKYKGFMWDNGLWEVVNQKNFELLRKMEKIEEEDTRLVVVFYDEETRDQFFKLICPILNNPSELDSILANRKKY